MGFKVVHTGQAKLVNKRVKNAAEMTSPRGWRISKRERRCTNLGDKCQPKMRITRVHEKLTRRWREG
jgi:hypothetical protein